MASPPSTPFSRTTSVNYDVSAEQSLASQLGGPHEEESLLVDYQQPPPPLVDEVTSLPATSFLSPIRYDTTETSLRGLFDATTELPKEIASGFAEAAASPYPPTLQTPEFLVPSLPGSRSHRGLPSPSTRSEPGMPRRRSPHSSSRQPQPSGSASSAAPSPLIGSPTNPVGYRRNLAPRDIMPIEAPTQRRNYQFVGAPTPRPIPPVSASNSLPPLAEEHPSLPPPRPRKRRPRGSDSLPGPSKRIKVETPSANTPTSTADSVTASEETENISLECIEDIAHCITMSSDHPSNVTGHFCDLFVGTHTAHGKVALKRPRIGQQEYTREDVRRFLREADTWRGLQHDHILSFIGTCRIDGYLYMVSPYIDNGTLSGYVEENPNVDRARLLYETAEAIAYLHRSGVIHGDIKATNILVSDTLHALLCDFGLTKFASTSTSTALKSAGSLRWQSPELWEEGKPKTYESDTYAFGMTIAEVLSGRIPFSNYEQAYGVVMAASFKNERPPTEPMFSPTAAPYYRTWHAAIHCWLKDPSKRPPMEEAARMLRPLVPPSPTPKPIAGSSRDENTPVIGLQVVQNVAGEVEHADAEEEEEETYCYCDGVSFGTMIDCCDQQCDREWFHLSCLGLYTKPVEPWYCLRCEAARMAS